MRSKGTIDGGDNPAHIRRMASTVSALRAKPVNPIIVPISKFMLDLAGP
jgi:hypothetical protein